MEVSGADIAAVSPRIRTSRANNTSVTCFRCLRHLGVLIEERSSKNIRERYSYNTYDIISQALGENRQLWKVRKDAVQPVRSTSYDRIRYQ